MRNRGASPPDLLGIPAAMATAALAHLPQQHGMTPLAVGAQYPGLPALRPEAVNQVNSQQIINNMVTRMFESSSSIAPTPIRASTSEQRAPGIEPPKKRQRKTKGKTRVEIKMECKVCHREYSSKGNLVRHHAVECNKPKLFWCPNCQSRFTHKHSVKTHIEGNIHKSTMAEYAARYGPKFFIFPGSELDTSATTVNPNTTQSSNNSISVTPEEQQLNATGNTVRPTPDVLPSSEESDVSPIS